MPRPKPKKLVFTSSEGRQRLPNLLQIAYGEKTVIGFDRYGQALGAIVPIEAVKMLARRDDQVDDDIKERIFRAACIMLEQLEIRSKLDVLEMNEDDLTTIGEIARKLAPADEKR